MIDQNNLTILLTILTIYQNHKSLELGIVVKRVVLVFFVVVVVHLLLSKVVTHLCSLFHVRLSHLRDSYISEYSREQVSTSK